MRRSVIMGEGLGGDFEPIEERLPLVENDPVALAINEEIAKMYDSYFEFDSHDQGCWLNEERRAALEGRPQRFNLRYVYAHICIIKRKESPESKGGWQ